MLGEIPFPDCLSPVSIRSFLMAVILGERAHCRAVLPLSSLTSLTVYYLGVLSDFLACQGFADATRGSPPFGRLAWPMLGTSPGLPVDSLLSPTWTTGACSCLSSQVGAVAVSTVPGGRQSPGHMPGQGPALRTAPPPAPWRTRSLRDCCLLHLICDQPLGGKQTSGRDSRACCVRFSLSLCCLLETMSPLPAGNKVSSLMDHRLPLPGVGLSAQWVTDIFADGDNSDRNTGYLPRGCVL